MSDEQHAETARRVSPAPRFYVRDLEGNVQRLTQTEWDARDTTLGWVRVDEHGNELDDDGQPRT